MRHGGGQAASGSQRLVVTNKASIALAPAGSNKGTGLRAALRALGLDDRPILAIGDAANDLPMFAVATIAVGVANSDDAVRAAGVPSQYVVKIKKSGVIIRDADKIVELWAAGVQPEDLRGVTVRVRSPRPPRTPEPPPVPAPEPDDG